MELSSSLRIPAAGAQDSFCGLNTDDLVPCSESFLRGLALAVIPHNSSPRLSELLNITVLIREDVGGVSRRAAVTGIFDRKRRISKATPKRFQMNGLEELLRRCGNVWCIGVEEFTDFDTYGFLVLRIEE